MKVSVIIPMYNAIDTIQGTLDSAIKQTYSSNFEILIINDGSNDGCEKIVETYIEINTSNRVIKLINKINTGVSSARNIGIKKAIGEYVAFLDSDDTWHPQKIEIMLSILSDKNIEIIGHGYTLENNFLETFKSFHIKKVSFCNLLFKNFAVTPSIMIKKEVCQYFDETMRYTEDHELWLRMSKDHQVYFCDLPLVVLGRKELSIGGLSGNRWAMRRGELDMYTKLYKINLLFIILIPFLITFSLSKHMIRLLKRC